VLDIATARIGPMDCRAGYCYARRGRRGPLCLTLCDGIHAEIARI
jgi:hypothetical protein